MKFFKKTRLYDFFNEKGDELKAIEYAGKLLQDKEKTGNSKANYTEIGHILIIDLYKLFGDKESYWFGMPDASFENTKIESGHRFFERLSEWEQYREKHGLLPR